MRFTTTFLGLVLLLSGVSARPSIRESCGADAQVIDKKTLVSSSGKEITFTTTACPGFATLRNATTTPSTVRKRQISQCGNACTSVECDTTVAQPVMTDCDELTTELIDLEETFALPPQSAVEATFGTCSYIYGNFDTVTYDVCTTSFGLLGNDAVTVCFDDFTPKVTFTAGFCLSPEVPGYDFIVESGRVSEA